ncbi:MAG TPA: TfoX/Sxy family protein [Burkholderiaceae bacterium]|nr:TfoX/Sxy family protein [Burkholderiaceae bacterium]
MSTALVDHCRELLAPLGAVRARRMFGGHGLYIDDLFVALIAFDRLYLKVDDATRADFEAAGGEPFAYEAAGRRVSLGYYTVPAEAMESPALMQPWARRAMSAALRARAARPPAAARSRRAAKPARPDTTRRRSR